MCQVRKCARVRMLINTVEYISKDSSERLEKRNPSCGTAGYFCELPFTSCSTSSHLFTFLFCIIYLKQVPIHLRGRLELPFFYIYIFKVHSQYFSLWHDDINVPLKSATLYLCHTHTHAQTHIISPLTLFSASINLSFLLCTVYLRPILFLRWPVFHSCGRPVLTVTESIQSLKLYSPWPEMRLF